MLADADQRDAVRRYAQGAEHREDLDDLQLVVEVGLEPQHEVARAVLRDRAIALLELRQRADVGGVLPREEARADPAQLGVGHGGHGALVEHVAPREDRVGEAGAQDAGHRRVAVGDVERRAGMRRPLGDHMGAGGGVGLARLGHPGADAPLELRLLGHRSSPATRPAGPPATGGGCGRRTRVSVREVDLPLPPARARLGRDRWRLGADGRRAERTGARRPGASGARRWRGRTRRAARNGR